MFHLSNLFGLKNDICNHRFPDTELIADLIDREGNEIRAYFCYKCKDYKYREIDQQLGDPHFFAKVKKDKYEIYCDLDKLQSKH